MQANLKGRAPQLHGTALTAADIAGVRTHYAAGAPRSRLALMYGCTDAEIRVAVKGIAKPRKPAPATPPRAKPRGTKSLYAHKAPRGGVLVACPCCGQLLVLAASGKGS